MNPPSRGPIVPHGGSGGAANGGDASQPPIQQIGNLVRYWVHYDNTLQQLNKEVKEARDHRKNYETQILQGMRAARLTNPVIQITGGRIVISEERHHAPLSLKSLEQLLHQYHRMKPGRPDETRDIMNFIKANRTVETAESLKRMYTPGAAGQNALV
jgi:hypothetical protein